MFNEAGRVVGVLWGTDGEVVVCVQPVGCTLRSSGDSRENA